MVKSAVRVVVRTRPTANFAHDSLRINPENRAVEVFVRKKETQGAVNNQRENYSFQFDAVLHNASQDTVFDDCARPIVSSVMEGYNGTILAYGQTGAGKTYTMTGGTGNYKVRGLIPRVIQQVFQEVSARPDQAITVRISYHENYNENLIDLLNLNGDGGSDLVILDDAKVGVHVRGLTQRLANNEEEALNLLFEGETNRAIGEHQLNAASSRSHCVFTLTIETRSRIESSERVTMSKLNMVDLAGSERVSKTGSSGIVLKEAMYINKSLSFLEQVVNALSDRHRDHIPFRQSKLTHVLKDSLGGNCKTTMIANIWGEGAHLEETISTLNFATRMMRVRNEAVVNVQMDADLLVRKYEREIKELKAELAMHDALSGRSRVSYEPYSEEQRFELNKKVVAYIQNDAEELEVVNLRHVNEIFMQFRIVARNAHAELDKIGGPGEGQGRKASAAKMQPGDSGAAQAGGGVGEVSGSHGFSVGVAPDDARPLGGVTAITRTAGTAGADTTPAGSPIPPSISHGPGAALPDRGEAFEEYKLREGKDAALLLKQNLTQLKERKRNQKECAASINACKAQIDALKNELALKQTDRPMHMTTGGGPEVIDEEEFALIKALKDQKKAYRSHFDELKQIKSETEYLQKLADQARNKLVQDFEDWFGALQRTTEGGEEEEDDIPQEEIMAGDGDVLDDGEIFDNLEVQRVMQEDPESLAYHNARKNMAGKHHLPRGRPSVGAKARR